MTRMPDCAGMCNLISTHTHTQVSSIPPWEDQCEWHRITRMTRPDCACARESDCAVRRIITAAKKRLQNLLYKPIILNSGPHSAQTLQQQLLLLLLLLELRQNGTRDAYKISPHGTMTKRQL